MSGTTRPRAVSSGDDSAATTRAGLAAEVAWALLVASALLRVAGPLSLAADIRRGRERHRQDVLIGKLWTAVKRIPAGQCSTTQSPAAGSVLSGMAAS